MSKPCICIDVSKNTPHLQGFINSIKTSISKPFKIEDRAGVRYSYEQIKFEFAKNTGTPDDFENISIYMYPKKKMI